MPRIPTDENLLVVREDLHDLNDIIYTFTVVKWCDECVVERMIHIPIPIDRSFGDLKVEFPVTPLVNVAYNTRGHNVICAEDI